MKVGTAPSSGISFMPIIVLKLEGTLSSSFLKKNSHKRCETLFVQQIWYLTQKAKWKGRCYSFSKFLHPFVRLCPPFTSFPFGLPSAPPLFFRCRQLRGSSVSPPVSTSQPPTASPTRFTTQIANILHWTALSIFTSWSIQTRTMGSPLSTLLSLPSLFPLFHRHLPTE